MPNGIDGWTSDKLSHSTDAVREAVEHEAYEERKRKKKVEDSLSDFDRSISCLSSSKPCRLTSYSYCSLVMT
ncbi:unnamed protein product [marine sediment metagenome]|uniref:Uncharacterized protein n=1 Tax=marine sediment metagenome TaxID=412755 RepID=X1T5C1_9ZZZZ